MLQLTAEESSILAGDRGEASKLCMQLISIAARAQGARRLIEIESAQIGSGWYSGESQYDFVLRLHELGARVAVPTSLAASRVCLTCPQYNSDAMIESRSTKLASMLSDFGCMLNFSCSPYLEGLRPAEGAAIAWTESSAVVYANSVLGARTNQGYDFIDLAMAVVGRAPYAGLYQSENRRAQIGIDLSSIPPRLLDYEPFFSVLGHFIGKKHDRSVPLLLGLPPTVGDRSLRSLSAMLAAAGSVRMFHAYGVLGMVRSEQRDTEFPTIRITATDLRPHRDALSPEALNQPLRAVCLGAPHISLDDISLIDKTLEGHTLREGITFSLSASRATLAEAARRGWVSALENKGARIFADTCSYLGLVRAGQSGLVMTSSGKWAYYAPSQYPVQPVLGSLEECVESAIEGRVVRDERLWSNDLWR